MRDAAGGQAPGVPDAAIPGPSPAERPVDRAGAAAAGVDLDALLTLAVGVVTRAGQLVRARAGDARAEGTKTSATDLVTDVDRASERLITDALLAARPDDGLLGEEDGERPGTSGVRWVLDPVDGTVNYAYGMPQYAVSLAAELSPPDPAADAREDADGRSGTRGGGEPLGDVVVGVVLDVARGRLFTAVAGRGAHVDGRPLRGPGATDLASAMLGTGFSYDPARRRRWGQVLTEVVDQVRDVRRLGSAALDLCAVAEGRLDCYAERDLHAWDLAAAGLVAREAGCRVEGLRGRRPGYDLVVAAPPALFDPLHDLLAGLRADED